MTAELLTAFAAGSLAGLLTYLLRRPVARARIAGWWELRRYAIGRAVMHFGLRLMPSGRAKSELLVILYTWGANVAEEIDRARAEQRPTLH